tara:strand:- start:42607 stop:42801 length:195 start_codon:yes stop_codon:yes gene_type:complete
MSKSQGKIVIKTSKNGEEYFNVVAENGQVLVTSETYKSRQGLDNGIKAVTELFQSNFKIEEKLD